MAKVICIALLVPFLGLLLYMILIDIACILARITGNIGRTAGRVVESAVSEDTDGDESHYYKYSFSAKGKEYSSSRINFLGDFRFSRTFKADSISREFENNQNIEVTYYKRFPRLCWIVSKVRIIQIVGNAVVLAFIGLLGWVLVKIVFGSGI